MNPVHHQTDSELVCLLVNGDALAFETIYHRYARELYAYARKNITSREDCEEIVHDVFEQIWQRHAELTFVTWLKGYLYRLLRFRLVEYFRHENVRRRYEEHYAFFEAVYEPVSDDTLDREVVHERIERRLLQLPERCQQAVKLRLHENLSNDAIAARMNINKSTVENYMAAALSHLRASFQGLKAG